MRNLCFCLILASLFSCSNNPYPHEHKSGNVFYTDIVAPPKDLDPQHSYTMLDLGMLKLCYEPLIDYGYLDQATLQPALASEVPEGKVQKNEKGEIIEVRYSFNLRQGVHFIDDACFPDGKGRELVAKDLEYAFMRAADAEVNCPIFNQLAFISGYRDFRERVEKARLALQEEYKGQDDSFDPKRNHIKSTALYERAGALKGIEITGKYSFDMVLDRKYPQILYWLAMRFISGIAHEAVDFYNPTRQMTTQTPVNFNLRPVGTGPYRILWEEFRKDQKVVMVKNENWWGKKIAAPTTRFPEKPFSPEDEELGYWTKEAAGQALAQIDRIEWYYEKESLTRFTKFQQGYYDINLLPTEKMGEVLAGQDLSEEMKQSGIRLNREVSLAVRYIGFNMSNDEIGAPKKFSDPALEAKREQTLQRNRYLRQAMSLAVDMEEYIRVHLKGMGQNAQNIIPPGVFGYRKDYQNPYKYKDESSLGKARELLKKAGYENGIDAATGEALKLEFTCAIRSASDTARYNFYIDCWNRIGLDVTLDGLEYNQFQNKVYDNRTQIFIWGWSADYPDPENFLFLLAGVNAPNPNYTNYANADYDKFFSKLEVMTNEESDEVEIERDGRTETVTMTRDELIQECIRVETEDCPWIFLYHEVDYRLYHSWLKNVKTHPLFTYPFHFYRLDKAPRTAARAKWNKPLIWPAYVLIIGFILLLFPAFRTYIRERN